MRWCRLPIRSQSTASTKKSISICQCLPEYAKGQTRFRSEISTTPRIFIYSSLPKRHRVSIVEGGKELPEGSEALAKMSQGADAALRESYAISRKARRQTRQMQIRMRWTHHVFAEIEEGERDAGHCVEPVIEICWSPRWQARMLVPLFQRPNDPRERLWKVRK